MRKSLMLAVCLVLCMALVGCSGNPLSKLPWAVNIYSYDLVSQVETDWEPKVAAPGFQWLLLEVTVSNKTSKTEMLNSLIYPFELVVSGRYYTIEPPTT